MGASAGRNEDNNADANDAAGYDRLNHEALT